MRGLSQAADDNSQEGEKVRATLRGMGIDLHTAGQQIGSNYDPTGNETQGRVTVVFRGNWAQATDVARTNVQGLEVLEVA